jgi:hypothetical protein
VGDVVGTSVREADGMAVGRAVGAVVGAAVGSSVGAAVGVVVGASVGTVVGPAVGVAVGTAVGSLMACEFDKSTSASATMIASAGFTLQSLSQACCWSLSCFLFCALCVLDASLLSASLRTSSSLNAGALSPPRPTLVAVAVGRAVERVDGATVGVPV